jgi:hypothetical protein
MLAIFSPHVLLGFELRASCLLGRRSSSWATLQSFLVIIFQIGSQVYACAGLDHDLGVAGMTGVHHHAQLLLDEIQS